MRIIISQWGMEENKVEGVESELQSTEISTTCFALL